MCVCGFSYTARKDHAPYYVTLSFVANLAVPYVPHYPCTMFGEKVIERKMCVLIFSTALSETFLIRGRTQRDDVINIHRCLGASSPLCFIYDEVGVLLSRNTTVLC